MGALYVISAPSGAGKTSLVKALVESSDGITVSISNTTRDKRPGEEDGINYNFTDVDTFKQMISDGAFLEHAQVFDNFYGTSQQQVEKQLASGEDVILEIDWQGAEQVRQRMDAVTIFILPPSEQELRVRLSDRGQDSEEIVDRRMRDSKSEMSHYAEFDYIVVNDDFSIALEQIRSIINSEDSSQELVKEKQVEKLQPLLKTLV